MCFKEPYVSARIDLYNPGLALQTFNSLFASGQMSLFSKLKKKKNCKSGVAFNTALLVFRMWTVLGDL